MDKAFNALALVEHLITERPGQNGILDEYIEWAQEIVGNEEL